MGRRGYAVGVGLVGLAGAFQSGSGPVCRRLMIACSWAEVSLLLATAWSRAGFRLAISLVRKSPSLPGCAAATWESDGGAAMPALSWAQATPRALAAAVMYCVMMA